MVEMGHLSGQVYHLPVRVYYEDTDQQGIVFYANYLKYFERGRTELLRHFGAAPAAVEADQGRVFVVAHLDISYRQSARLDEVLDVQTRLDHLGKVKIRMDQRIYRGDQLITQAKVTVAILDQAGRPARLNAALEQRFAALLPVA